MTQVNKNTRRAIQTALYARRKASNIYFGWTKDERRQASYSKWAAEEAIRKMRDNPKTPPLIILEDFKEELDEYSCKNTYTSFIFSVAKDTIQWIIDLLLA